MTGIDLWALLPILIIAAGALILLMSLALFRDDRATFAVSLVTLATALASLAATHSTPHPVTQLLVIDRFGAFFMGLLFAAGIVVTLLLRDSLGRKGETGEAYLLLLTSTLGAAVLVASQHFAAFFLGLETLTVSLYGLIAYEKTAPRQLEAGIKYLIMAAVSSGFLLFGLALIYTETGTMQLPVIEQLIRSSNTQAPIFLGGIALVAVGIGFKMAVVPFHMWTPDIYEGAPAAVTGYIATASKGAVFAFLLRYFVPPEPSTGHPLFLLFAAIAVASMITGNLLALLQTNVKRILAYSSIAHLGYLLVAFLAGGPLAKTAASFYLAAYFATMLAAFGVLSNLSSPSTRIEQISDLTALYWKRPGPAVVFTFSLFSLAGIPLTAGFLGKFYLAASGVEESLYRLVIVLVVTSGIGLFYYLRMIVAMASPEKTTPERRSLGKLSPAGIVTLASLLAALVWMGVYPETLLSLIRITAGG